MSFAVIHVVKSASVYNCVGLYLRNNLPDLVEIRLVKLKGSCEKFRRGWRWWSCVESAVYQVLAFFRRFLNKFGSELSADATVKYRDARKKIHEAFAGLKLANVSVTERGLLVDQKGQMQNPYFFGGMQPNARAKTEVQLSRKMVVVARDIRQMDEEKLLQQVSRLLDVAQDAGAKIGPQNNFNPYYYRFNSNNDTQGLIRFVLDDFDKLEEEAYEKAIADARSRAERLARLSKVELGSIVAVRETSVPSDHASPGENEMPRKRIEVSKFQEIPVRVELLVRFEIRAPRTDVKGRPGE